MQAPLVAHLEARVVGGLHPVKPNIFAQHLIGDVAAGRDKVATGPQVSPPERRAQLPVIHQEVVRRFPLNRLHDATRSELGRHAQQQVHMIGAHVPLQDLDLERPTHLANQVSHFGADVANEHRLADTWC